MRKTIIIITAIILIIAVMNCGNSGEHTTAVLGHSNAMLLVRHGEFQGIVIDKSKPHNSTWHETFASEFIAEGAYYSTIIFFVPAMYSYIDPEDMLIELIEGSLYGEFAIVPSWCGRGDDEAVLRLLHSLRDKYGITVVDTKDIVTADGCHYEPEGYLEISRRLYDR
jgi:hypothetical protein